MADENSVQSSQTGAGSAKLFGNMFGSKEETLPVELDANGNVIKTKEMIALEQKQLAESIARKKEKKWYQINPINKVRERLTRSSVRERRLMLLREETMKQDLERFLMELEERNCWLAYELNGRNYSRMVNAETIASSRRREMAKIEETRREQELETGLKFFRGNIRGYRRYQCSAAKHLDLKGHAAAVFSCKLSRCLQYVLSCSGDKTVKLWSAGSGSLLKTFYGHTRKVLDGDFHPRFQAEVREPGIITCGGDGSVRCWNAMSDKPSLVVKVHAEAVYKTSFSPDGERVVTCSEDCTVKTWSFPEMYPMYTYKYHTSPVCTVRFSPTGRFIVSGSDFGERKLAVWDGSYPRIDQALQFPHMIFWTETGLISKLLIKAAVPTDQFWLNQNQLTQLDSSTEIDQWLGQDDNDDPTISDSESEDEETKAKRLERENFGLDDVKEAHGVLLVVDRCDGDGIQTLTRRAADEYQPGGSLLVSLETFTKPIAEAFGSVNIRDARFDTYSPKSGGRIGKFSLTLPTPGCPALQDALGLRPPFRVVPEGITATAKDAAFTYKSEKQRFLERGIEEARLKKIEDAKKLDIANETDPEKKRANLLLKKRRDAPEEVVKKVVKKPTPALGKNIVVLREAIKPAPRKKDLQQTIDPDEPLPTIAETEDVTMKKHSAPDGFMGDIMEVFVKEESEYSGGVDEEPLDLRGMECMWLCPADGGMGSAVVTVNVRLEGETQWHRLAYSLRESPIKVIAKKKANMDDFGMIVADLGNVGPNGEKYMFDQEAKHLELWTYIREKNWDGVESMLTKNALAYYNDKIVARSGKVTELLESIFGASTQNLVVPNPFRYRPGLTRCSVLIEATEAGTVHRGTFYRAGRGGGSSGSSEYSDSDGSSSSGSGSYSDGSGTDGEGSYSSGSSGNNTASEAMTAISQKINSKKRPRNSMPLVIPSYIFSSTEGLSRKEIKRLARNEANGILKMRKRRIAASEEVRQFAISVSKEEVADRLLQLDAIQTEATVSTTAAVDKKNKGLKKVAFVKGIDDGEAKNLLKNGRFGPDEGMFCMDLPELFPRAAGEAKGALEDHLVRYRKMREKAERDRIRTAEELREAEAERANKKLIPAWIRHIIYYSQTEEAKLASRLEADLSLYALTESAYNARRQLAMPELPGMLPHYPAEDGKYLPSRRMLFSMSEPPAKIKAATKKARELAQRGPVGRGKIGYMPPGIPTSDYGKTGMDLVLAAADRAAESDIIGTTINVDKTDDDSTVAAGSVADADALVLKKPMAMPNTGEKASETSEKAVKGHRGGVVHDETCPERGFTKKRKGFPDNVFLERRMSFAHLPGLEPLSGFSLRETHLEMLAADAFQNNKRNAVDGTSNAEGISTAHLQRHAEGGQAGSQRYDSRGLDSSTSSVALVRLLRVSPDVEIAHHGTIFDAVFSPSERRLASAGGDCLIKFWDPRDGSMVRALRGHESEVTALAYTANEAYLVSTGADHIILVWDLMVNRVTRTLKGHVDVINAIAISPDCTTLVSASYDWTVRTWKMTPQAPEKPLPPKLVAKSDTMIMISWSAPPCFNEELTAQFLQYRVNSYHKWVPEVPISIPPHYRSKVFRDMPSTTTFRFRVMAENRMGKSEWSNQSREMKTDMGLPSVCEVPLVCGVSPHTLSIFWFSQSIKHYGSAPTSFIIETSGDGKEFGECPSIEVAAMTCEEAGVALLQTFKAMHRNRTVVGAAGGKNKNKDIITGVSIPTPHLLAAINKSLGKDIVIMTCTIENLTPGHLYRTRLKGMNSLGQSEWSPPSLTQSTLAGLPAVPEPPVITSRSLTSITWAWKPPNDGGSALTGYRLWIKHWNYFVDLPRWQTSYVLGRLLPGKPYFVRVLAKNVVGFTEYSEYNENSVTNSFTAIEPPDAPRSPSVVAGTCRSLTIQFQLPYLNGSPITTAFVQRRIIEPFSKGPWGSECVYEINNPRVVQVVKHIDYIAEEFDTAMDNNRKADGSYNPFDRKVKKKKELTAKINKYDLVGGPEYVLRKSEGSIMQIEITSLTADTVYEFRVACRNEAGRGMFSPQSTRAKANRPELPGVMIPPQWENIAPTMASFVLTAPEFQGGVSITHYTMEVLNLDSMLAVTERHASTETEFELLNMTPGGRYKARVAAENKVGLGAFSQYTKVVILPLSAAELIAMGTNNDISTADNTLAPV